MRNFTLASDVSAIVEPTSFLSHRSRVKRRSIAGRGICLITVGVSLIACHDLVGTHLPAGTQDPSYYNDATGALGMRNAAVIAFGQTLPDYIITTGLLTDELSDPTVVTATSGDIVNNNGMIVDPLDERILPELSFGTTNQYRSDNTYINLQGVRAQLLQAIGQLATYDTSAQDTTLLKPAAGRVLRGELYALYGLTEIELADLFCSGVPLSTLDYQQDFTYRAGAATAQVYQDAIVKLDAALALSADSARVSNLVRLGLGRAYLDLGDALAASDDVSVVPDGYQYQLSERVGLTGITQNHIMTLVLNTSGVVSNGEGGTGLPYSSSGDPRTAAVQVPIGVHSNGDAVMAGYPSLYASGLVVGGGGQSPITVASGVEARLIEAEAALQPGGAGVGVWLAKLNGLRETAPIPGTTQSTGLPDLSDPGTDSARVALTFRERAFWLYMTGHRQGDLRRQLRQYPQYWPDPSMLYPTGVYSGLGAGFYGTDVTAPIPADEYLNPLFHGCLNRAP